MILRLLLRPLVLTAAIGAVLTGCGSSAPAVDATGTKAFAYDIAHRNFAGTMYAKSDKAQVLALGQGVCAQLDKGHTVAQVGAAMLATKSLKATSDEDAAFVSTVVLTLCPKYLSQVVPPSGATATPAPAK